MSHSSFSNANFPTDGEGRTYHVGVKRGEIANRLITVGDAGRAKLLKKYLNPVFFEHLSERLFYTVTGLYNGVPVTIMASLMGYPNMDFGVRETLAVVDGTLVAMRYGTCGTPRSDINLGDLALASSCYCIYRNPDGFRAQNKNNITPELLYPISLPVPGDPELFAHMKERLVKHAPDLVKFGAGVSGCTFYASQGRPATDFADHNEDVIGRISAIPNATSIEMESFHLFDLADISINHRLRAGAAAIVIAKRDTNAFISNETKAQRIEDYGHQILAGLAAFPIKEEELMKGDECVWLKKGVTKIKDGVKLKK